MVCSIYAYVLEATDEDFAYAAHEINAAFHEAGKVEPIALWKIFPKLPDF